jgi:hypothetical protein
MKLKLSWDRRSAGQSVCLGVGYTSVAHDQIFFPVWQLQVSWCGAPSLTRGLACTLLVQLLLGLARAVTHGSKSLKTHDHILRSNLRLSQPGGPDPLFILPLPPGTGWSSYSLKHWVPFSSPLTTRRAVVSYNNSYISTWHQAESKRSSKEVCSKKIEVKHAQSGTMIQMEVIMFAMHISYNPVPCVLDLGTSWRRVVSFTHLSLYPPGERIPGTRWIGGWVDSRADVDVTEKWNLLSLLRPELRLLGRLARSQSLYRLRYRGNTLVAAYIPIISVQSQKHFSKLDSVQFSLNSA